MPSSEGPTSLSFVIVPEGGTGAAIGQSQNQQDKCGEFSPLEMFVLWGVNQEELKSRRSSQNLCPRSLNIIFIKESRLYRNLDDPSEYLRQTRGGKKTAEWTDEGDSRLKGWVRKEGGVREGEMRLLLSGV
ncbi:hypothetical protein MHYP_G00311830 [Metynnis hypsauchen]